MEHLFILVIVFSIAFVFSMFGMGGGLLYMPVFLFFLSNHASASFLSFLCIFVTAFSAMSVYYRKGLIDWKLVGYLGAPLIAVVFTSGFFIKHTPNSLLRDILGITLISAGIFMIFSTKDLTGVQSLGRTLSRWFPHRTYRFHPVVLFPIILLIGFLSGMSGIAGGVFEIPIMIGLIGINAHAAVATSSAIVTLVALSGALGRFFLSASHDAGLSLPLILCMALFVMLGGQIGPNVSIRLDKTTFKRICGVFVLLIGVIFIIKV